MKRSGVCMSVRLSRRSTAATAVDGRAAERRPLQQISIDSCGRRVAGTGAQQQTRVASQSRRRKLNTDLLTECESAVS